MNFANWPKRYRLLCLMFIMSTALFMVGVAQRQIIGNEKDTKRVPASSMLFAEASSSPLNGAAGAPTGTHWKSLREMFPHFDGLLPSGSYWVKLTPPDLEWGNNSSMYVYNMMYLRVYADGKELYRYDSSTTGALASPYFNWHLIPLNPNLEGKELTLWIDSRGMRTPLPAIQIDKPETVLREIIKFEIFNYMLGALFLFCGMASLFFCFRRKERFYIYMALFAFAAGYSSLVRNHSFTLLVENTWFSYLHDIALPFCAYAFIGILENLFPELYARTHRWLRFILLGFSIMTAAAALTSPYLYFLLLLNYFPILFLVTFGAIIRTIYRAYRVNEGAETIWLMSGFSIVTINALLHLTSVTYIPVYWLAQKWFPPLRYWNNTLLFWSIFVLMICFVRVLYGRYEAVNRQLETFNRSLEEMVSRRTTELQDTHLRLTESLRDSAEAMAAALVMEERQRIAYTIHDTVGHTLTATIVQMEAAKRLMDKDAELAKSKFEASQQLVRKGLDEIRGSVRLLQEDPADYDLAGAMQSLIAETSAATGVIIDKHIGALPGDMTILQKRVLYHALQEGLTNGIRHGKCDRFSFLLAAEGHALTFRLSNNGAPYSQAEFGFGLRAMEDRVKQLDGSLRIEQGDSGTVLTLILPIRNGEH